MVTAIIVILTVVSAVSIFYTGLLVGKTIQLRGFKRHIIDTYKPEFMPDDIVRDATSKKIQEYISHKRLIKRRSTNHTKQEYFIFYTRNEH